LRNTLCHKFNAAKSVLINNLKPIATKLKKQKSFQTLNISKYNEVRKKTITKTDMGWEPG